MPEFLAYGLRVAAAAGLPGLPPARGRGAADIVFRQAAARPVARTRAKWVPLAFLEASDPEVAVRRVAGGRLLRFRGRGSFRVSSSGAEITASPEPDVPEAETLRLFLDQVLPCVLAHGGRTVLHAACVASDGRAAAFVGRSGAGKSTLAEAMARTGFSVLADDALAVEDTAEGPRALPAHAAVRPRPGGRAARSGATAGHGAPLRRIYLLAPPGSGRRPARPSILPVSRRDALVALVDQSYRLDPADRGRIRAEFDALSRSPLLALVRRLSYPLGADRLPAVVQAVAEDLRKA